MSMLEELSVNSHIYAVKPALNEAMCAQLIERFEAATEEQYQGRVGQLALENESIKRSTDLVISGKPNWKDADTMLFRSLAQALNVLKQEYAFFNEGSFKDFGYAIQRTLPGEYFHWHVDGGSHSFSHRQLVAIWYLNDVAGPGGETEFRHYSLKVQPEVGKLLLFPPFWTHEHRGVTLKAGVKYIATTWVMFADD